MSVKNLRKKMDAAKSVKKLSKRVTAAKYQGDDHYSWAVFEDGVAKITGLSKREVPYYKKVILDRLIAKEAKNGTQETSTKQARGPSVYHGLS